MSKKLVNSPEHAVDEAHSGLVAANPGLRLLAGHRVIVRADTEDVVNEGKVTLLCGGGSGHEPAHGGYVGKGLLTAAVAGSIFASPPPSSILAALRAIRSPAGTLIVFKNYTGDRLNFGIALERAKAEGMNVAMVIVGEDCALPTSNSKSTGRRGLCGVVLVNKIAGAMAEKGCSFQEIVDTAQKVIVNIATMSVSLSPCSIPGQEPSFTLEEDEMELGLGIHGEAGAKRIKLQPADEVAKLLIDRIMSQEAGFKYFAADKGTEIVLVVNNLGGTSNLELCIMTNAAIRYLVDQHQLRVVRVFMGCFVTSLEMAGVSFTLFKVCPDWTQHLDFPTTALSWPNASVGPHGSRERTDSSFVPSQTGPSFNPDGSCHEPTTAIGIVMRKCIVAACETLSNHEAELNRLDSGGGDADCGSTHSAGAKAILENLSAIEWDNPGKALLTIAGYIENQMGGTSGAIYTLFLTAGAGALLDAEKPVSWANALEEGIQAIMRYGRAKPGDRTMLDALCPAADVLCRELPGTTPETSLAVLRKAVEAAASGVKLTASMEAQAGRASYVHSSQLTQPDPGAHAVALWLGAILQALTS